MLQEAKELQLEAVIKLTEIYSKKKEVFFKAPTGSGKTYMMADFMNRVLSEDPNAIFIVSTLSKGDLAKQNYQSFEIFRDYGFDHINPYLINSDSSSEERIVIVPDYNVYVLPRDLYKKESKLKKGGSFIAFLKSMKKENKKIYLIKDECHIHTRNLDSLSEYFTTTINFSATPPKSQKLDIEIKESDAVECKLIKSVKYMDYYDENNLEESLRHALNEFVSVKEKYINKETNVIPCFIIQISNKEKADQEWKTVKQVLDKWHSGLKWMLIVNKSSGKNCGKEDEMKCDTNDQIKDKGVPVAKWKDFAKKNTSVIDVIIFKMVISEGWDIPRACMLYQIRKTKSEQLSEQVIGRVRRNPLLMQFNRTNEKEYDFTMTAYVWGTNIEGKRKKVKVSMKKTDPQIPDEIEITPTILSGLQTCEFDANKIISDTLNNVTAKLPSLSVFTMYRQYMKTDNEIKERCSKYVLENARNDADASQMWLAIMKNSASISKSYTESVCNYSKNMRAISPVTLPSCSSYDENSEYTCSIDDWIWENTDKSGDSKFSFDSLAEKAWAEKLAGLARKKNSEKMTIAYEVEDSEEEDVYLWGKNYVDDSEIKYQYYLNGIHNSYPDFVLKDSFGRMHIFEVKSVNVSGSFNIDNESYLEKVNALKECYKYASQITGHDFWLPIQSGSEWIIFHYKDSVEDQMSFEQFREYLKTNG